ncbi:MAG: methyltransferase domain-containing protein [Chloroflexi bacterium]|nr:methyltransferase domain-containing protein [Chloroflexota bacterium]
MFKKRPKQTHPALASPEAARHLPSYTRLSELMGRYTTDHLVNVSPDAFEQSIRGYLDLVDHEMEGFSDPDRQRDLSIRFHWGHDHDFGSFQLKGRMKDRHLRLLATFFDVFEELPKDLSGLRILDIGAWTGGTSLALCALGAEVVAIEEVKKYVDSLNYLKQAFDIQGLEVRHLSLYDLTTDDFQDAFDIVLFTGVLYHVSDPLIALRLTFNALKDGGVSLIETHMLDEAGQILSYEGPGAVRGGKREDLSRGGWNWFFPTPKTLEQMILDVGYADTRVLPTGFQRALAVAQRDTHVDIMRSGLSMRHIR